MLKLDVPDNWDFDDGRQSIAEPMDDPGAGLRDGYLPSRPGIRMD